MRTGWYVLVVFLLGLLVIQGVAADTGGTISYVMVGGVNYTVHTFTGNDTYTVTTAKNIEVLVIAGGGGGGADNAGGGGAGGLIYNASYPVVEQAYPVVIGAGGAGGTLATDYGGYGQNTTIGTLNANGGGGGNGNGGSGADGHNGGSGGGAGISGGVLNGGTASPAGQGNNGGGSNNGAGTAPYAGAGGGGCGAVGQSANPGNGGAGCTYNLTGTPTCYAGGGGGGGNSGAGTATCGGGAGKSGSGAATSGTANTGGGGGGGGSTNQGPGGAGGSGLVIVRYPTPTLNTTVVTLTLSNVVNGSAWPSAVTFSNVSGSLTFAYFNITASGFCVSYSGNGTGTNCSAGNGASAFYNVTVAQVISTSATVSASTFGSLLRVNATTAILGVAVSAFNVTNGLLTNTTASGSLTIAGNAGVQSVTIDVAGNYSMAVTCTGVAVTTVDCEITDVHDNLFKINATSAITGAPVLNFSIVANYSGFSSSLNTTNGTLYVPTSQGYSYTFTIDATGFAYANVTRAANASTNTYQFSLLPQNSIFLYFFDQTTLASIFSNVSVTFNNGTSSFSNTSNTSEMIASALTPGTWTITATATGYEPSQYFVTVGVGSSQDLDVYLLNSSLTGETTITIKDANTADVISNATVTIQIKVGSNWVTSEQQTSDLFGVTFFELEQGTEYQLIVEAPGYVTKTGLFVRTTSSYIVTLSAENTQDFTQYGDDFSYAILPSAVENNLTTFSITTSSPGGALEWFAVVVTLNGSTTTQNVTGSPSGGTASVSLNLSGFSRDPVYATYYVKGVSFNDPLVISRSWIIYGFDEGNYTLSDFMTRYADDDNGFTTTSRGIIATIGAVLLGFLLGSIFGAGAAVLGAAMVFIVAAFYGWIHWSIIAVVVGGLIAAFALGRNG